MYVNPGGVAWLREKYSLGFCQVSVKQIKSNSESRMNSLRMVLLLLRDLMFSSPNLRDSCFEGDEAEVGTDRRLK